MSKYMTFETDVFVNRELLVEALRGLGMTEVETGDDLALCGWDRRDLRTADVVVRKSKFPDRQLFGDVGFKKTAAGFVPIIDDMDLTHNLGDGFMIRLRNEYHEAAARQLAKRLGGKISRETNGRTVKIRIRY